MPYSQNTSELGHHSVFTGRQCWELFWRCNRRGRSQLFLEPGVVASTVVTALESEAEDHYKFQDSLVYIFCTFKDHTSMNNMVM